jgi:hypothetical protein
MTKRDDDFFVGYAPSPVTDRRFFLAAGLALTAGAAGLAAVVAKLQRPPGPGSWDMTVRDWTGVITAKPYAMLRTADLDGSPRMVLLSCLGKCGVAALIGAYEAQTVRIKGSLIARGRHAMIAVPELEPDWIAPSPAVDAGALGFPKPEFITDVDLAGEILDSKCWFGAMRPSEGKGHKACASLCIKGGIPPAFFARDTKGRQALMILTDDAAAHGPELLPYVADPVRVKGRVSRWGDLLLLNAPVRQIKRI